MQRIHSPILEHSRTEYLHMAPHLPLYGVQGVLLIIASNKQSATRLPPVHDQAGFIIQHTRVRCGWSRARPFGASGFDFSYFLFYRKLRENIRHICENVAA